MQVQIGDDLLEFILRSEHPIFYHSACPSTHLPYRSGRALVDSVTVVTERAVDFKCAPLCLCIEALFLQGCPAEAEAAAC